MDQPNPVNNERKDLVPVEAGSSGVGSPYAPEDWPEAGDVWRWKVGKRKTNSGHWIDRYLSPPRRFGRNTLASKPAVATYVKNKFPGADVDKFFASFTWLIPSSREVAGGRVVENSNCVTLDAGSQLMDLDDDDAERCVAGNKACFLQQQNSTYYLDEMDCDICCKEPGFCRNCCCILCCRTIDWEYEGYSFVKCEAKVGDNRICGHVAHLECAIRCYMAGTVGGTIIKLDVEYYCRRCDNRGDLFGHVEKTLQTCKTVGSSEIIRKMLSLASSILRGSEQAVSKKFMSSIQCALEELCHGVNTGELRNGGNEFVTISSGSTSDDIPLAHYFMGVESSLICPKRYGGENGAKLTSDHQVDSLKIENEIDQVLGSLRKSQESEFKLAEQKLYSQRDVLLSLNRQLEFERSELAKCASSLDKTKSEALLTNVISKAEQLEQEKIKLKRMMEINKGFGRTPRKILMEHFFLENDD